jgi:plastocyanin
MMKPNRSRFVTWTALLCALLTAGPLPARGADVTAQIEVELPGKHQKARSSEPLYAVLWLNSLSGDQRPPQKEPQTRHYQLVQHNKTFTPHLLVVPVNSGVEFPNLDPFFHNVFSLFNGKRFDLGLYASGSTRTVHFDHEGVSYIFCNIHPQMAAVVIALKTPYFAEASPDGKITLPGVPAGAYELKVWTEGADPGELNSLTRPIQIASAHQDLGLIRIMLNGQGEKHKNKFGEDYPPADVSPY